MLPAVSYSARFDQPDPKAGRNAEWEGGRNKPLPSLPSLPPASVNWNGDIIDSHAHPQTSRAEGERFQSRSRGGHFQSADYRFDPESGPRLLKQEWGTPPRGACTRKARIISFCVLAVVGVGGAVLVGLAAAGDMHQA